MRDTYSTQPKKDDIRTKLKSQGKPAGATIELGAVKPPPRKGFNIEEMNQTMRVPDRKNVETEQDEPAKRATTFDARQPVQTLPKDDEKSDLDRQSVQSPASPSWESQRAKVDFMKLRNNKNSVSPEQYKIGNNLVVNLADPIKKPSDVARMNQTSYNKGGKANFFPSTATATTNGSSGNGSQDPRRTTDSTRQPSQQN